MQSHYFGDLSHTNDSVIEFPEGLPGFENERRFLPVELPQHRPLIFLQSLATPGLCFPTLPVLSLDPHYHLRLAPEDAARLGFAAGARPAVGRELLGLAIITISESAITANLLAPVVVNPATRLAAQVVAGDTGYSHRHVLKAKEVPPCS